MNHSAVTRGTHWQTMKFDSHDALKNLAGAFLAKAVRCTLTLGREVKTEILDDPFMHVSNPIPDEFVAARRAMVQDQIRKRGVSSRRILEAMLSVP